MMPDPQLLTASLPVPAQLSLSRLVAPLLLYMTLLPAYGGQPATWPAAPVPASPLSVPLLPVLPTPTAPRYLPIPSPSPAPMSLTRVWSAPAPRPGPGLRALT